MRPKLMHRTNIYLTPYEMKEFKVLSQKKRLSISELIRRVLDEWLEKQSEKKRS